MHIDEIVDSIAGQFERELDHVFKQQVRTNVVAGRAETIRQYIDRYNSYPSSLISQLNCLETTKVEISECCSVDLKCKVVRTKEKVPTPIRVRGLSSSWIFVGAVDNSIAYGYLTDPSDLQHILKDRFMKGKIFYAHINDYLYIFNDDPDEIRARAIFGDLDLVAKLNSCEDSKDCDGLYNIPEDFVVIVKNFVYNEMRTTPVIPNEEEVKIQQDE